MDEVAFVESLFEPELRSTPQPSPTQSLLISTSLTPWSLSLPSSLASSPRRRSFNFMPTNGTPNSSPGTLRLGVGPEEEEVFRQLLNEHEFDESLAMPTQIDHVADHLHGASLMEPIDLPKINAGCSAFDPAFKDVFLNMASPLVVSPSGFGLPNFKAFSPMDAPRGSLFDPHRTPRNSGGYYHENRNTPVQPIGAVLPAATPGPIASMSALQALHEAVWSNNPAGNVPRLNPNSIKNIMIAATTASAPRGATAPSPIGPVVPGIGSRSHFPLPPTPVWAPSLMLTPTAAGHAMPDLTRNISSKKSKARKPSNSVARSSAAASNLAASLGSQTMPKKRTPASKKVPAVAQPLVVMPSQTSDSDDPESKNAKGKKCVEEGCVRRAQSNSRCKAHGGGARCQFAGPGGCTRSSQGGGFCRAHGGGKRCEYPDCTRGQQRKGRCYVHGGIRKCQTDGCEKKDRGNGFCISHGGGKRCVFPGCSRSVRRGNVCQLHEDSASVSSAS